MVDIDDPTIVQLCSLPARPDTRRCVRSSSRVIEKVDLSVSARPDAVIVLIRAEVLHNSNRMYFTSIAKPGIFPEPASTHTGHTMFVFHIRYHYNYN